MEILSRALNERYLWPTWIVAMLAIAVLGFVRHNTETEFAFASAAIIPVFLVAWAGGLRHGIAASALGAGMWVITDLVYAADQSRSLLAVVNGLIRLATYCFIAYLTARVRTLLQREIELSSHDALTGLLNRRAFLGAGNAEVSRARRYRISMAVVFVDLDDFKKLNDDRGHDAGDAALRAAAAALARTLRTTDTVARIGGDEFAIILPEIGDVSAGEASRKIGEALAAALVPYPPVAASLGVAWFGQPTESFEAMLKTADALMYEAKNAGKGHAILKSFD